MKPTKKFLFAPYVWIVGYFLVLVLFNALFSRTYFPVDYLGQRAAVWSAVFIPLLTLAIHLGLLRLLPFYLFAFLLGLDALADIAVATHWAYYGAAPSILNLVSAIHETSLGVLQSGNFISGKLLATLAIKWIALLLLAWRLKPRLALKPVAWANLFVASLLGFAFFMRPPTDAARPYAYEVCIKTQGLYTAALSELAFRDRFLVSAPENSGPAAIRIPQGNLEVPDEYLHSILAIQVESLDWEVLGFSHQGVPATPFLNSVRDQAVVLKLDPHHSSISGSSGADFQFLAMRPPPHRRLALREKELESIPSLPRAMRERGFQTVAMHANAGAFWSRDKAYPRLGISRFLEKHSYPAVDGGWGVSDQTFFDVNAKIINDTSAPTFFFMITLSSHAPFRWVRDPVFQGEGITFDYLNSIHYTDRSLERFFGQLQGKHLVFLYGDHASSVQNPHYNSKPGGKEFVPGMVFMLDRGKVLTPPSHGLPSDLLSGDYDLRSFGALVKAVIAQTPPRQSAPQP